MPFVNLVLAAAALVAVPAPVHYSHGDVTQPTFSVDGSTLAFVRDDPFGHSSIVLARADGSGQRVVPGEGRNPSLHGKLIAFDDGGSVWIERRDGSHRTRVAAGQDPEWSPDGRRIAFVRNGDIYVGARRITRDGSNLGPSWSPDGRKIVFAHGGMLEVVRADGSGRRSLGRGIEPAWSPDGRMIAFSGPAGVYVMRSDGTHRRLALRNAFKAAWRPVRGSRLYRRESRRAARSRRSGLRAQAHR